jgi:hypothetical protein
MEILGPADVTVDRAKTWARARNAAPAFVTLADLYWLEAPATGVRPEVAYAQAAKETNWGRFGGVLDPSFRNVAGIKTRGASGDRPEDHARFPTWKAGVRAHLDHLALYAGAPGYPRSKTPDPRHFPFLHGTARTVERLGGKWAPSESYGREVAELTTTLVGRPGGGLPPFAFGWLDSAGPFPIERIPCPFLGGNVDLERPRAGVMHTIEGGWTSGLSVFRQHFAPHFMVGSDGTRSRIAQLVPLGKAAATLVNSSGGPDTNSWACVQIEMVGFSRLAPWTPDLPTARRLSALFETLRDECGIPLSRPFPDTLAPGTVWATPSNPRRASGKWGRVAGWFGHVEVPENAHWDPGSLQMRSIFALGADDPAPTPGPEPERPAWHILRRGVDTGKVVYRDDLADDLRAEANRPGWGDITLRRVRRADP